MLDGSTQLIERATDAASGASALPWSVHALVGVAMVVGLVIWVSGQKVLRAMVVVLCALIGAGLGHFGAPLLTQALPITESVRAGFLGGFEGLLIGLISGGLAGLLIYRSAMALGMGLVMAVLCPLAAAAVLHFRPLSTDEGTSATEAEQTAREYADEAVTIGRALGDELGGHARDLAARVPFRPDSASASDSDKADPALSLPLPKSIPFDYQFAAPAIPKHLRPAADRVHGFVKQAGEEANSTWQSIPVAHRAVMSLSAIGGLALGVVLGLAMPAWAGGAATAMFGAGIWLSCFGWLTKALSAPWSGALEQTPLRWLMIWAAAAFLGMCIQWSGLLQRRPRAARAPE